MQTLMATVSTSILVTEESRVNASQRPSRYSEDQRFRQRWRAKGFVSATGKEKEASLVKLGLDAVKFSAVEAVSALCLL